jgi:hypothetical protein
MREKNCQKNHSKYSIHSLQPGHQRHLLPMCENKTVDTHLEHEIEWQGTRGTRNEMNGSSYKRGKGQIKFNIDRKSEYNWTK